MNPRSLSGHGISSNMDNFPPSLPNGFVDWLKDEFTTIPDALSIPDVIHIIGYTDTTVDRWIALGYIKTV